MRIEMKQWEIERIKEIITDILELWTHDSIEVSNASGHALSMSVESFFEQLERELKR